MKKHLLPARGKFYKANLHTHTNVSDGIFSPAEIKERFKAEGYSVVAYTDHEVMVPHEELRDDGFLPITSIEISVTDGAWRSYCKCYHLNIYSPIPARSTTAVFCDSAVWGNARAYVTEEMKQAGMSERRCTKEFIQSIIDAANGEGCLVSYNHPVWSLQNYTDYSGLKGFWGVEWHNTGCTRAGYADTAQPIKDLLAEGERRVFPLATDDCHGKDDCFGGWVQIKAPSLEYDAIFNALSKGNFYSSNGPAIKSLYLEDAKVTVKTSAARRISVISDQRWTKSINADGKLVTGATFDLQKFIENAKSAPEGHNTYFRLEVIDKAGHVALTRAYFLDDLGLI